MSLNLSLVWLFERPEQWTLLDVLFVLGLPLQEELYW